MPEDEIVQIRVGSQNIGIIGLKSVLEEIAADYDAKSDKAVQMEIMNRICKKNYIPSSASETYSKAFLREFKKYIGKPYEEETPPGTEIKVLGQGCAQCNRLMQELMEIAADIGLQASIEHITDIKEIGKYGVMGMPALLINDKVMSAGRMPLKKKLIEWLMEFKK